MENFSKRHGFSSTEEVDISVREDAPMELRRFISQLAYDHGFEPSSLRQLVCRALKKPPNQSNWTEYPNIDNEVYELLRNCKWYKAYDIIEQILNNLNKTACQREIFGSFETEMNEYFLENGIGWKIVGGLIEYRGPDSFESIIKSAQATEQNSGHITASKELHQAIGDLSRRPSPDPTGAIQHAMASLECVARQLTGDQKANLGDIMKRHGTLLPNPLDQAIIKAWGYASENGRHIREGREPSINEAELVVGLCASIGNYLIKASKSEAHL